MPGRLAGYSARSAAASRTSAATIAAVKPVCGIGSRSGAIDANPCPLDGPPSAWIEIATSACARLPIAARSVMQGPHAGLVGRVGQHDVRARSSQHAP